jgi:transcriptional regulator with XRE-family HTH domain
MQFDLFTLHVPDEDLRPRSWICLNGKNLPKLIDNLINDIIASNPPQEYVKLNQQFRINLIDEAAKNGSQRKLAKRLGVTQQRISKWRLGERKIPFKFLLALSKEANINFEKVKENIISVERDNRTGLNLYKISKNISGKLNCSVSLVWRVFQKRKWYPIPILLELLELWRNTSSNKNGKDVKIHKEEIVSHVEYLKLNNSVSVPVKAVKELNETICKIAGAHAADGNLSLQLRFSSKDKEKLQEKLNLVSSILNKHTNIVWNKSKKCWCFYYNISPAEFKLLKKLLTQRKREMSISLSLIYKITVTDEYKGSIKKFCEWVEEVFNLNVNSRRSINKNEWYAVIVNKIIARYFHIYFGFPYSKKSSIVEEPPLIKNSEFKFRKAFASGVMTFDGSVSLEGQIALTLKSKPLLDSVYEIITSEIPKLWFEKGESNRGEFFFRSLKPNTLIGRKLLEYFEADTEKWHRLNEIINGFQAVPFSLEEAIDVLSNFDKNSKINVANIVESLSELKAADIKCLVKYLKNKLKLPKLSVTPVRKRLILLRRNNIVTITKTKNGRTIKYIYNFNPNIFEWKVPRFHET